MRIALLVLALSCVAAQAYAQSSPIPESRVPGFGGTNSGTIANSPSAVGSNVGSNVGAGATAGPSNDIVTPSNPPLQHDPNPPPGQSGSITITR